MKSIGDILQEIYIGKIIVDTEFSSKGDFEYYESIGVEYPGFDGEILSVEFSSDEDGDPMILFRTDKGIVKVYDNDRLEIKEKEKDCINL